MNEFPRTIISKKCSCKTLVFVIFSLHYCSIFSLYLRVPPFSLECFRKVCSFCWFKWVEFLRTESMPYLFCIISFPLAPLSRHMSTHHNFWLAVLGTEQVQCKHMSRKSTRGYLICFPTLILSGVVKIHILLDVTGVFVSKCFPVK